MTKIGELELFRTYDLLIPSGQICVVVETIGSWTFGFEVRFEDDAPSQSISVHPDGDRAVLTFKKWTNTLGTALTKPGSIAELSDGRRLVFYAVCSTIGDMKKLTLQLMFEGKLHD